MRIGPLENEARKILLIVVWVVLRNRFFVYILFLFVIVGIHSRDSLFQAVIVKHIVILEGIVVEVIITRVPMGRDLWLFVLFSLSMPFLQKFLGIRGPHHIKAKP